MPRLHVADNSPWADLFCCSAIFMNLVYTTQDRKPLACHFTSLQYIITVEFLSWTSWFYPYFWYEERNCGKKHFTLVFQAITCYFWSWHVSYCVSAILVVMWSLRIAVCCFFYIIAVGHFDSFLVRYCLPKTWFNLNNHILAWEHWL